MNRLDNLIRELCPYGVAYTRIADISTVLRGKRLTKNELTIAGAFPVFHGGLEPLGFYSQKNREADTTMVINVGASAGTVGFCERDFWSSDGCFCISHSEHALSKYVYYVLVNQQSFLMSKVRKAGIPTLDAKVVENLRIPLPSLAVQQKIVRILDSFTGLMTKLNEKLTAELTARRKQYEYYRDKLLSLDAPQWRVQVARQKLAEIADISTGSSNTDDAIENGLYPFYVRSQEPLAKNEYEFDEEAIITAGDGVGVGKVFHYIKGKYALHQRAYRIHPTAGTLNGRFLHYYFTTKFPAYIGKQMYQGSVPSIRRPMLNNFEVLIPPIEVQQQIVDILDRIDLICSDLTSGLPAEIAARQKQYEYYRDSALPVSEPPAPCRRRRREAPAGQAHLRLHRWFWKFPAADALKTRLPAGFF